jgi:hypothetical protein
MRRIAALVLFLVGAGVNLTGCGSDDDESTSSSSAICSEVEALLNQKNESLHCPSGGEVLADLCRSGLSSKPGCAGTVQAFYDCARGRPDSEWQCHPAFEYPSLITASCKSQDDAIGNCFNS